MSGKYLSRSLPFSLLLNSAAVMQGLAVRVFADEAVRAEVVAGVEPEQLECRPLERLGGKVKIRKSECRGRS